MLKDKTKEVIVTRTDFMFRKNTKILRCTAIPHEPPNKSMHGTSLVCTCSSCMIYCVFTNSSWGFYKSMYSTSLVFTYFSCRIFCVFVIQFFEPTTFQTISSNSHGFRESELNCSCFEKLVLSVTTSNPKVAQSVTRIASLHIVMAPFLTSW